MPHYRTPDIEFKPDDTAPALMKTFVGAFMKAALVHYDEGADDLRQAMAEMKD